MANADSARCYFLEIPAELRLEIYDYVYPKKSHAFHVLNWRVTTTAHTPSGTATGGLLATCSKIYTEARPVLYGNTKYRLTMGTSSDLTFVQRRGVDVDRETARCPSIHDKHGHRFGPACTDFDCVDPQTKRLDCGLAAEFAGFKFGVAFEIKTCVWDHAGARSFYYDKQEKAERWVALRAVVDVLKQREKLKFLGVDFHFRLDARSPVVRTVLWGSADTEYARSACEIVAELERKEIECVRIVASPDSVGELNCFQLKQKMMR